MTRRILVAVLTVVMSAAALAMQATPAGPDLTGSWAGTIAIPDKGRRVKNPLHAAFKQAGDQLTGTIGPEASAQLGISKGRVETTKFGTVVTFDMPGAGFVMHFELRPDGSALRGVARLDGEKATAPVELQIVK
jgi:hypothetical protein